MTSQLAGTESHCEASGRVVQLPCVEGGAEVATHFLGLAALGLCLGMGQGEVIQGHESWTIRQTRPHTGQ